MNEMKRKKELDFSHAGGTVCKETCEGVVLIVLERDVHLKRCRVEQGPQAVLRSEGDWTRQSFTAYEHTLTLITLDIFCFGVQPCTQHTQQTTGL